MQALARRALEAVQVTLVKLNAAAAKHWGVTEAFEHTLRLLTGRTHQIRAQMAAVAAPLLGDTLYQCMVDGGVITPVPGISERSSGAVVVPQKRDRASQAHEGRQSDGDTTTGNLWLSRWRELDKEDAPLGLQAARLTLPADGEQGPPEFDFDAGVPWWRCPDPGAGT